MKLIQVVRKECIVAGTQLQSKAAVLESVVEAANRCSVLEGISADAILTGLRERESLGSTGFGNGIAIPHCRLKGVNEFVVGLMTVAGGVDFDAIDNEPVKLIVFIIAPENESNKHIRLLSAISQALLVPGAVKELLAGSSAEGLYESFLRHSRADIDTSEQEGKRLFHVFVQEEKLFQDIFVQMAQVESNSLVVVNAENAAMYMSRMPLFADFWNDEPDKFSKVILAVVEKGLANETLRRIESVTGDLKKKRGVMVTIQEMFYSAGLLNA